MDPRGREGWPVLNNKFPANNKSATRLTGLQASVERSLVNRSTGLLIFFFFFIYLPFSHFFIFLGSLVDLSEGGGKIHERF